MKGKAGDGEVEVNDGRGTWARSTSTQAHSCMDHARAGGGMETVGATGMWGVWPMRRRGKKELCAVQQVECEALTALFGRHIDRKKGESKNGWSFSHESESERGIASAAVGSERDLAQRGASR
eukprot:2966337-Pleurochrysis_carterae.AAC.1